MIDPVFLSASVYNSFLNATRQAARWLVLPMRDRVMDSTIEQMEQYAIVRGFVR